MSNPFFSRNPYFNDGSNTSVPQATGSNNANAAYGQSYGQTAYGQQSSGQAGAQTTYAQAAYGQQAAQQYGQVQPEQVYGMEQQFQAPAALNADMGRMTYDDVIVRTAMMFAAILGVGAVSWTLVTSSDTSMSSLGFMIFMAGVFGGLILGMVNSFKREPSPALIMTYAVFEGAMLGGFSGVMEATYPGIVMQAVLATLATFGVMLVAYRNAGFRVSGKMRRVLLVAMGGYALFSLINFGLMITGTVSDPWGLRTSVTIMGIPLGLILGVAAVVMAALSLAMDFEFIQKGVERGLPQRYAWAGAFGLVVTLVWLYVEFVRIIAILNRR